MRPSTFRRCGAALLFALFLPSCTDAPTAPRTSPGGDAASSPRGIPAAPSSAGVLVLVPQALEHGHAAALRAREAGADPAQARSAAFTAAAEFLSRRGIYEPLTDGSAGAGSKRGELTGERLRYLEEVQAALEGLDPRTDADEAVRRLARIEERAYVELRGSDREAITTAIQSVSQFWMAYSIQAAPHQGLGAASGALALAAGGGPFPWGRFAGRVSQGIYIGAVSGAAGGMYMFGGQGAVGGAIAGGVTGGVAYGLDYLFDYWYS